MEKKRKIQSVEDLNERVWYRILKVFFIIIIGTILLFPIVKEYQLRAEEANEKENKLRIGRESAIDSKLEERMKGWEKNNPSKWYIHRDPKAEFEANQALLEENKEGWEEKQEFKRKRADAQKKIREELEEVYPEIKIPIELFTREFVISVTIFYVIVAIVVYLARGSFYYIILGKFFVRKKTKHR